MDNRHSAKLLTFKGGSKFKVIGGFQIQVSGEDPIDIKELKEERTKGIVKTVGRIRRN